MSRPSVAGAKSIGSRMLYGSPVVAYVSDSVGFSLLQGPVQAAWPNKLAGQFFMPPFNTLAANFTSGGNGGAGVNGLYSKNNYYPWFTHETKFTGGTSVDLGGQPRLNNRVFSQSTQLSPREYFSRPEKLDVTQGTGLTLQTYMMSTGATDNNFGTISTSLDDSSTSAQSAVSVSLNSYAPVAETTIAGPVVAVSGITSADDLSFEGQMLPGVTPAANSLFICTGAMYRTGLPGVSWMSLSQPSYRVTTFLDTSKYAADCWRHLVAYGVTDVVINLVINSGESGAVVAGDYARLAARIASYVPGVSITFLSCYDFVSTVGGTGAFMQQDIDTLYADYQTTAAAGIPCCFIDMSQGFVTAAAAKTLGYFLPAEYVHYAPVGQSAYALAWAGKYKEMLALPAGSRSGAPRRFPQVGL